MARERMPSPGLFSESSGQEVLARLWAEQGGHQNRCPIVAARCPLGDVANDL
jgi:hypothetical protein